MTEAKKTEINRLASMLKEVNQESDELMKDNMEIENINIQLQKDLHICIKHLENVSKNNSAVKERLDAYSKVNLIAIKKLRRPLDEGWVDLNVKKDLEGLESTAEGFLERST